jgi:hypothetical protein
MENIVLLLIIVLTIQLTASLRLATDARSFHKSSSLFMGRAAAVRAGTAINLYNA